MCLPHCQSLRNIGVYSFRKSVNKGIHSVTKIQSVSDYRNTGNVSGHVHVYPPGSYLWGASAPQYSHTGCSMEKYYIRNLEFLKHTSSYQIIVRNPFKIEEWGGKIPLTICLGTITNLSSDKVLWGVVRLKFASYQGHLWIFSLKVSCTRS